MKKNVFIVHGHDHNDRDDLYELISELGLVPKVLELEEQSGGTIIEEFENLAEDCVFAFILLTPDDKQAENLNTKERFRARQNVIFEMGWFFRKLGKHRTRLLHKGEVELPSDVTGVIYIPYKDNIKSIRAKIRRALVEGGLL